MYTLLLSWRYLRTRWIAVASIVSVMLGVATMIVVNSIMAGFTHEMEDRLHNILSDVAVESTSFGGFSDPDRHMQEIQAVCGEYIESMTPIVAVPGLLSFQWRNQTLTKQINFIGIDTQTVGKVNNLAQFLQHPKNREQLSFDLRENGYDISDHTLGNPEGRERAELESAGWARRRWWAQAEKAYREQLKAEEALNEKNHAKPPENTPGTDAATESAQEVPEEDVFASTHTPEAIFDPETEQRTGIVVGLGLVTARDARDGNLRFLVQPGDDVQVSIPTVGNPPKFPSDSFTIVDCYESKMEFYDSLFVFAPLARVQQMRRMIDPSTGIGSVTGIQIKLKDDKDGNLVRDKLQMIFHPAYYRVETWRDNQTTLLSAVQVEAAALNVLLFLIVAVAGFGILAIFFMIVVEKTKDIGVLKSLGASARGVMMIFLAYGMSLGIVGSGVGLICGLIFVRYINQIAAFLGKLTGRNIFDPRVYFLPKIPTIVEVHTVLWIVAGALAIAVLASILPARRAARLHPVQALRYE